MRSKIREIDIQPTDHIVFIHIPKTAGTTFSAITELLSGLSYYPEYFLTMLVQSDLDELRNFQLFRERFPYALFSDIISSPPKLYLAQKLILASTSEISRGL